MLRYIKEMYQLDAFTQSNPADQDIINIYKQQQGVRYAHTYHSHQNYDDHHHHHQVKEARGVGVSLLHNLHPLLTGRLRFPIVIIMATPHHLHHIHNGYIATTPIIIYSLRLPLHFLLPFLFWKTMGIFFYNSSHSQVFLPRLASWSFIRTDAAS